MSLGASRGLALRRAILALAVWMAMAPALPVAAADGTAAHGAAPDAPPLLDRLPPGWRDDQGQVRRLPPLKGRRIFVTMAYASCHRICPMTMSRLLEIQHDLDARGTTAEFLIVGYDPVNDDPRAWRRYRERRDLLRANWHFLTGTPADTAQLARLLGFQYWRDGDHVMHDYRIVALGDDGALRGVLDSAHGDWQGLL